MKCALQRNRTALTLNDRFRKRQSQTDALCVRCLAASVKTFEDVMDLLGSNAAAIIRDPNDTSQGRYFPCDADSAIGIHMVQSVFDNVADGFACQ